ncbi:MAG: hypothetical protein GQ582_09100 [Methyloprofundus sp.]|nr:hypothetical protein [Methyloprofundus sp.]
MLNLDSTIDVSQFFKWWGTQLSFLVPPKFREAMARDKSLFIAEIKGSSAKISYINKGEESFLGEFDSNENDGGTLLHRLIESNRQYKDAKVVLRVPAHLTVVQDVFLPAAAADNLAQVMGYELDRYTPFSRDQVYFDFIEIGPVNNGALIHIILILVQKSDLDEMYEQCLSLGMRPFYAKSAELIKVPEAVSSHYNLLPDGLCQKVSKFPLFIMLSSVLLSLTLFAVLLFVPLKVAEDNLNDLKRHVRKVERVALEIEDSKRSIDYLYQETQAIIDKKNAAPPMIDVINTLTQVLKDDTWVSNLRYFNHTLQISGQSGSASSLIGSLEKIHFFSNTRFISPVTKDKRSGLERFKISTEMIQKISDADSETEQ